MMADDVVAHTTSSGNIQIWLDTCSRWAYRKAIKFERSKCTVICSSKTEATNDDIKLFIGGGEINKATSATYLGMMLTTNGLREDMNVKRSTEVIQKAFPVETTARLNKTAAQGRTRFILDTYLRSKYLYKAILLNENRKIGDVGIEVCRRLFKTKERGIETKAVPILQGLTQTIPLKEKLAADTANFVRKVKQTAEKEPPPKNRNESKVRDHTNRIEWVLQSIQAPRRLKDK